jgi:hypothetical protein
VLNSINIPPEQPVAVIQTVHPDQYSQIEPYFSRYVPYWGVPQWLDGRLWRNIVRSQPILMICRDFIVNTILSLDWQIIARDSEKRKTYEDDIDYYTRGILKDFGVAYTDLVEWVVQDLYDLPFGAGVEMGRQNDDPNGKIVWLEPLDGTTLFPTLNEEWPVMQRLWEGLSFGPVFFPAHAINRVRISPKTEILRKGWGMPPPEKIYMALEMLNRGDQYYANLLLDTPPAGILDLGDMEKQSALSWIGSFRNLMNGIDAFKIPVLYEHNTKVDFIPFGKNPNDVMFDRISLKYAAICASAYGETLSDIGLEHQAGGGDTLAGSVRNERKTKQTGKSFAKRKMREFFDNILPPYLSFRYVDVDEEESIATGRARLATSTAFHTMLTDGYISRGEARLQSIADGMFTVPIPETLPPDAVPMQTTPGFKESGSKQVGTQNVPVSQGGQGDVGTSMRSMAGRSKLKEVIQSLLQKLPHQATDVRLSRLVKIALKAMYPSIKKSLDTLDDLELELWNSTQTKILFDDGTDELDPDSLIMVQKANSEIEQKLQTDLDKSKKWWSVVSDDDITNRLMPVIMEEFSRSLEDTTIDLQGALYADGLTDEPVPPQHSVSVTNNDVLKRLQVLAGAMAGQINEGTAFYIRRIIMSSIRDTMSTPPYSDQIKQGIDIDTILADNRVVRTIVRGALAELESLVDLRSTTIADFETSRIDKIAAQEEYKQSGLKTKAWKCYGDNPCPTCLENESQGFVPVDFKYKSVFTDDEIEAPPAHPKVEHCGLIFDRSELADLYNQGKFKLWYGE